MATSAEYITFVCEQLPADLGAVRFRKMFGEYMVYLNDKPILTVCDNTGFVKLLPELGELLHDAPVGAPYDGAKPHYILDIENPTLVRGVVTVLEAATPVPKARKKKNEIN